MAEKKFEYIETNALKPYENNSKKHPQKQLDILKKSIKEFGFVSPVLVDRELNIIAGHGRTLAAQELGLTRVPCVYVDGLTEEQKKAYIIADNKLTELGGWDKEVLAEELAELQISDFDIELTGFNDIDLPSLNSFHLYGDERERTNKAYNLDILEQSELGGDFWQMPVIKNDGYIPEKLTGFNYAKTNKDKCTGIHFFIDDYQFERIWNYPEKYIEVLAQYDCILSPDFSLYTEMPMPMKIWNVYRSRQIGSYYQSHGIKVIPTISWCEPETFQFCFEGITQGSIVAVSTVGVKESENALKLWRDGMDAMIEHIEPSTILVYGGELEHDYKGIPVKYYENNVLKEWRKR